MLVMKIETLCILILALVVGSGCHSCNKTGSDLIAHNLRVEYKAEPVIDVEIPRFSWSAGN